VVVFSELKSKLFNEFQKFKELVKKRQVVTLPLLRLIMAKNYVQKNSITFVLNTE
jgi:hypothetical protein